MRSFTFESPPAIRTVIDLSFLGCCIDFVDIPDTVYLVRSYISIPHGQQPVLNFGPDSELTTLHLMNDVASEGRFCCFVRLSERPLKRFRDTLDF
jgi:hypothetical protein